MQAQIGHLALGFANCRERLILAKRQLGPVLTLEVLCTGYDMVIDNANELLNAATTLMQECPPAALAIAELGQEEVGKSLSLLAAMALPKDPVAWDWFWRGWRSHRLKAHRAFLYELVSTRRIELHGPDGVVLSGQSLRGSLPGEKEAGIYVDFDDATQSFVAPSDAVNSVEVGHRIFTLLYLTLTARGLYRALRRDGGVGRCGLFAEIAFRICSEDLYQQDMPAVFTEFSGRSPVHAALMRTLENELQMAREELQDLIIRRKER